jgi:hypothetical protein
MSEPARSCGQHTATGQRGARLQYARPHLCGASRGAQAIPNRRRANRPRGARHEGAGNCRQCDARGAGLLGEKRTNLMKREYSFQKAPRCSATSKRTRERCKAPAVRGWTVCRFHGARGGGPKGERNGMYRHGLNTKEAMKERHSYSTIARNVMRGNLMKETWTTRAKLLLSCLDVQGGRRPG